MLYWMKCTHQFSHVRKYRCVNRCCADSINMTKLLVLLYNRFDVAKIQRLHKSSIVCIFRHLRHRLHFSRIDCKSISLSIVMISISNISHRFAFVIKVQIVLLTSKILIRDSEREAIFSSRSIFFEIFEFQILSNDLLYHLLADIMVRVSQSDFEQKFENDFSCSFVYLY